MANSKSIDRLPFICAAGKVSVRTHTTGDLLRIYDSEDLFKTIARKNTSNLAEGPTPRTPRIPESNLTDILSPELNKSLFVTFRDHFMENLYFKKHELGQVLPLDLKPKGSENITFGNVSTSDVSLYELILPKKSVEEVNRDYIKWHDKYVFTHKHYLPGEQVNRGYDRTNFNPKQTFGKSDNADFSGTNVRRVLDNFTEKSKFPITNETQEQFLEQNHSLIGKPLKKHNYGLSPDTFYGHIQRPDMYSVKELMEQSEPHEYAKLLGKSLSYINKLRRRLFCRKSFFAVDVQKALEEVDPKQKGYLTWDMIFNVTRTLFHYMDEEKVAVAGKHFGFENEAGEVDYYKFLKMIQLRYPLPKMEHKGAMAKMYNKETTYSKFCEAAIDAQNCSAPIKSAAGDLENEFPQNRGCRVLTENLGDETTAKSLIAPSIPMQFGLSHRDFLLPRSKEEIRRIFKNTKLDDAQFEGIWKKALNLWTSQGNRVSVEAFKYAMTSI